jgi:hypothetical protein
MGEFEPLAAMEMRQRPLLAAELTGARDVPNEHAVRAT